MIFQRSSIPKVKSLISNEFIYPHSSFKIGANRFVKRRIFHYSSPAANLAGSMENKPVGYQV